MNSLLKYNLTWQINSEYPIGFAIGCILIAWSIWFLFKWQFTSIELKSHEEYCLKKNGIKMVQIYKDGFGPKRSKVTKMSEKENIKSIHLFVMSGNYAVFFWLLLFFGLGTFVC